MKPFVICECKRVLFFGVVNIHFFSNKFLSLKSFHRSFKPVMNEEKSIPLFGSSGCLFSVQRALRRREGWTSFGESPPLFLLFTGRNALVFQKGQLFQI